MKLLEDIMDKSFFRKIDPLYYGTIVYVLLSLILGISLLNFLVIFLGWNMILATIAYGLSKLSNHLKKKSVNSIYLVLSFLCWLLFFPNTFYLLTDLIHFQNYGFFNSYPNVYYYDLSNWLVFFHLVIGAFYGAKLGVSSIHQIEEAYLIKHKFKSIIIVAIFYLSSIGIYIGRFIRLNSWNFLKIPNALLEIFSEFTFFLGFTTIFMFLHLFCYILFKRDYIKNL
jgi:uncharacterized membrane protein